MRKLFGTLLVVALVLSFSLVATTPAAAATHYVNPGESIQAAIDAAAPGDTIIVAAGTYQENMASWKDMEITKSLTLIGAGSGQTIIELTQGKTNGMEIRGSGLSVTIEGITFTRRPDSDYASDYGLRIAETASTFTSLVLRDVEVAHAHAANVQLASAGTFDSVTVEDCSFHHAGTWGFLVSGQVNSMTVTDSDFEHCGQVGSAHGIGFDLAGPGPNTNVTVTGGSFSHNTHTGLLMAQASDVTIKDIVASYNAGHSGAGFGIRIDEWQGKTQDVLIENVTASHNALEGISIQPEKEDAIENVSIVGATLSHNGRDGLGLWYIHSGTNNPEMTGVSIKFSNIFGNAGYGVRVDAWWVAMPIPEVFDATHNWWGDASGPSGEGPGSGDSVTANVDFEPWLGAAITDQLAGCTADSDTGPTASPSTDNVSAASTGGGGDTVVYVAEFVGNPTSVSPGLAAGAFFFDIFVSGSTPSQLVVVANCPGGNCAGMVLKWFDRTESRWRNVTPVSVVGGTVVATLSDTSVPTVEQLKGQPFGLGNTPPAVGWEGSSVNKVAVMAPWIALFAAMIAGATLIAVRRRRAQV